MEQSGSIEASVKALSDKTVPTAQRVEAYSALAMQLKAMSSSAPMPDDVFNYRKSLLEAVLSDISSGIGSSSHTCITPHSLQTLGYMLFNEHLARDLDCVEVSKIVKAMCTLVLKETTPKGVCTRALWCLASQNIDGKYMSELVDEVIALVRHVLCSPYYLTSASLVSESISILEKLSAQCKESFLKACPVWYVILVRALFSRHCKVHQKALQIAVNSEEALKANQSIGSWLHKELKTHLVSNMMEAITTKSVDIQVLMKIWAHFVSVLGKSFLKSGTLLNEMLKIVELGFKHKSVLVQVEAYHSWKALVDSFALDKDLLMNQKRLKLIMMPLMSSAVKQRCLEVDASRVTTWWHLIEKLQMSKAGSAKLRLFRTVCLPFLLFCMGIDPKTDLYSLLPQVEQELGASPQTTPPVHTNSFFSHVTPREVFIVLSSPSTLQSKTIDIPSISYAILPSQPLLSTGCHAFLQLIGIEIHLEKSLIKSNLSRNTAYEIGMIPVHVLFIILFFLEGLISYHGILLPDEENEAILHFCNSVVFSLHSGHITPSIDGTVLFSLLEAMLRMNFVSQNTLSVVLSSIADLPLHLLASSILSHITDSNEGVQDGFCEAMLKMVLTILCTTGKKQALVTLCGWLFDLAVMSHVKATDDLGKHHDVFLHLLSILESHISSEEQVTLEIAGDIWIELADKLALNLKEMSQASKFSHLQPNLDVVSHVLQFPFVNWIAMGETESSRLFFMWKKLFHILQVHVGLSDQDPNLTVKLIARDLLGAASEGAQKCIHQQTYNETSLISDLDGFQSALASVGLVLIDELSLLSGQSSKELVEAVQDISSLLAWQLRQVILLIHKAKETMDSLAAPDIVCTGVRNMFNFVTTSDTIELLSSTIAQPMRELMKVMFLAHENSTDPHLTCTKTNKHADNVYLVWKSICTCFQSHYKKCSPSKLLAILAPMLEVAFLCKRPVVVRETAEFWCNSFGKELKLEYTPGLKSALTNLISSDTNSLQIPAPGLELHTSDGSGSDQFGPSSAVGGEVGSTMQQQVTSVTKPQGVVPNSSLDITKGMPTSGKLEEGRNSSKVHMNPSGETEIQVAVPEIASDNTYSYLQQTTPIKVLPSTVVETFQVVKKQVGLEESIAISVPLATSTDLGAIKGIQVTSLCSHHLSQSEQLTVSAADSNEPRPSCTSVNSSHESDFSTDFTCNSDSNKTESTVTQHKVGQLVSTEEHVNAKVSSINPGLDVTVISPPPSPSIVKMDSTGQTPTSQKSPLTVVVKPPYSPVSTRSLRKKRKRKDEDHSEIDTRSSKRKPDNKVSPSMGPDSDFTRPHKKNKRISARTSRSSKMSPVQLLPPVIHKKPISSLAKAKKSRQGSPNTTAQADTVEDSVTVSLPSKTSQPSDLISMHASVSPGYKSSHCSNSTADMFPSSTDVDMTLKEVENSGLQTGRNHGTCIDQSILTQSQTPPPIAKQTVTPAKLSYVNVQTETSISSGGNISTSSVPVITPAMVPSCNQSDVSIPSSSIIFPSAGTMIPIISATGSIDSSKQVFATSTDPGYNESVTFSHESINSSTSSFTSANIAKSTTACVSTCVVAGSSTLSLPPSQQHSTTTSFPSIGVTTLIHSLISSPLLFQQKFASAGKNLTLLGMSGALGSAASLPIFLNTASFVHKAVSRSTPSLSTNTDFTLSANPIQQCSSMQPTARCSVTTYPSSNKDMSKQYSTSEKPNDKQDITLTVQNSVVSAPTSSVTQSLVSDAVNMSELVTGTHGEGSKVLNLASNTTSASDSSTLSSSNRTNVGSSLNSTDQILHSQTDYSSLSSATISVDETVDAKKEGCTNVMEAKVLDQENLGENLQVRFFPKDSVTIEIVEDTENMVSESINLGPVAMQASASFLKVDANEVQGTTRMVENAPKELHENTLPAGMLVSGQSSECVYTTVGIEKPGTDDLVLINPESINNQVSVLGPTLSPVAGPRSLNTTQTSDHTIASKHALTYENSDSDHANSVQPPKVQMDSNHSSVLSEYPLNPSCKSAENSVLNSGMDPLEILDSDSSPSTPTHQVYCSGSPRTTPAGILKHTSQFDSPSSASKGLRVQFANPVVAHEQELTATPLTSFRTAKHSRSSRKDSFTSRRTLELAGSVADNSSTSSVGKVGEPQNVPSASEPVFPNLANCPSPVEQILPALSPSGRFSHGLYNVVCAKNILTVGDLSSLTEQEVQTLPIKSPKVNILKSALQKFEGQVQRQKRKPSKEDSTGFPPSKHHAVDCESPIPSQQSDSMDVFKDDHGENMDIPFVALYCADDVPGITHGKDNEKIDVSDDSAVVALEGTKVDFEKPFNCVSTTEEMTYNCQKKSAMEEIMPVSSSKEFEHGTVQQFTAECYPVKKCSLNTILHDHNYLCTSTMELIAGGEKFVKEVKTTENFCAEHCRSEEKIDEVVHGRGVAVSDERQSMMFECPLENNDLEQHVTETIACETEANSQVYVATVNMADVPVYDKERKSHHSCHTQGSADFYCTKKSVVAVVNQKEIKGSSAFHLDDSMVKGCSVGAEVNTKCINTDASLKTMSVTMQREINSETLSKEADESSQDSQICKEKYYQATSHGDFILSPMQANVMALSQVQEGSQELFSEPVSVKHPRTINGAQGRATVVEVVCDEEELNTDVVDPSLQVNPSLLADTNLQDDPSVQTHLCSGTSVRINSGSKQQQNLVNFLSSSMEQESLLSARVSSVLSTATQASEFTSANEHHDFTSLAQLTADNLEVLESNLQHIVPSSVGHRLYHVMIKVMSRFPEYFQNS